MRTNEENIIQNFICFIYCKVEPEPKLYTGSVSDQKVPALTSSGSTTLITCLYICEVIRRTTIFLKLQWTMSGD